MIHSKAGVRWRGETKMRIKQVTSQHRNDFYADMECEHCGHQDKRTPGYNDAHFHQKVIPAMTCGLCGKNRAGEVPTPAAPHDLSQPTHGT